MDEEAALILKSVKVNNRTALVSAFPDRLVIVDASGTRAIPIGDLARITHKAGSTADRHGTVVGGRRDTDRYQVLVRLALAGGWSSQVGSIRLAMPFPRSGDASPVTKSRSTWATRNPQRW